MPFSTYSMLASAPVGGTAPGGVTAAPASSSTYTICNLQIDPSTGTSSGLRSFRGDIRVGGDCGSGGASGGGGGLGGGGATGGGAPGGGAPSPSPAEAALEAAITIAKGVTTFDRATDAITALRSAITVSGLATDNPVHTRANTELDRLIGIPNPSTTGGGGGGPPAPSISALSTALNEEAVINAMSGESSINAAIGRLNAALSSAEATDPNRTAVNTRITELQRLLTPVSPPNPGATGGGGTTTTLPHVPPPVSTHSPPVSPPGVGGVPPPGGGGGGGSSTTPSPPVSTLPAADDTYVKMKKTNIPINIILNKMKSDGMSETQIKEYNMTASPWIAANISERNTFFASPPLSNEDKTIIDTVTPLLDRTYTTALDLATALYTANKTTLFGKHIREICKSYSSLNCNEVLTAYNNLKKPPKSSGGGGGGGGGSDPPPALGGGGSVVPETQESLATKIANQDSSVGKMSGLIFAYNIDTIIAGLKTYGGFTDSGIKKLISAAQTRSGSKLKSMFSSTLQKSLLKKLHPSSGENSDENTRRGGRRSPRRTTRKHRTSYRRNRKASRRR